MSRSTKRWAGVGLVLLGAWALGCSSGEERGGDKGESSAVLKGVLGETTTLFSEAFSTSSGGFTYADDKFRGTAQPSYASGVRITSGGNPGAALRVNVGGINSALVTSMSGGWNRSFMLSTLSRVTVTFHYKLTQSAEYESNERSELLLSVDGALYGLGLNERASEIAGDGNGGIPVTTGWQTSTPSRQHTRRWRQRVGGLGANRVCQLKVFVVRTLGSLRKDRR